VRNKGLPGRSRLRKPCEHGSDAPDAGIGLLGFPRTCIEIMFIGSRGKTKESFQYLVLPLPG